MSLTFARVEPAKETPQHIGQWRAVLVDITFDASYPTGGETIAAADVGLVTLLAILDLGTPTTSGGTGLLPEYDVTNGKLKLLYADYDAVADGALIEVANASDQSGVTRRCLCIGV